MRFGLHAPQRRKFSTIVLACLLATAGSAFAIGPGFAADMAVKAPPVAR